LRAPRRAPKDGRHESPNRHPGIQERQRMSRANAPAKAKRAATSVRSVRYSTSPLLASRTPPWRSKFLVALVGASFCVLLGRAAYVQIVGSAFFLKQGEIRYGRTLDLPASRGRILDRSGLILASSVPAPCAALPIRRARCSRRRRRHGARSSWSRWSARASACCSDARCTCR